MSLYAMISYKLFIRNHDSTYDYKHHPIDGLRKDNPFIVNIFLNVCN